MSQTKKIYDFSVNDIYGSTLDWEAHKGKKIMVVNTASKCGLTPQYETLEDLYQEYKDKGLVIIGFPANNFGAQEPGSNEEIATFCQKNYGLSFPMMSKISVKGTDMHPLYHWLTNKSENGVEDSEVSWNFQKYLIDAEGNYVRMIAPQESPASEQVLDWLND